jgi:hypothetical protein
MKWLVSSIIPAAMVISYPLGAQGNKIGKLHIKAAPTVANGQEFADFRREQSVNDLKQTPRRFYLTQNEADADYLLVVLERKELPGTGILWKTLTAALSIRDGVAWKPALTLDSGEQGSWPLAANKITGQAEDWVLKNIDVRAVSFPQSTQPWPAGYYVKTKNPNSFLELVDGGKFLLRQGTSTVQGEYSVEGEALTLVLGKEKEVSKISPTGIREKNGDFWQRGPDSSPRPTVAPAESTPGAAPLTVDQIVEMVKAKVPDDMIIKSIETSGSKFTLTPEVLIRLKNAGVSDTVIRAMSRK